MSAQKQFEKYEAVILLDNYIKHIDGKISRKDAI